MCGGGGGGVSVSVCVWVWGGRGGGGVFLCPYPSSTMDPVAAIDILYKTIIIINSLFEE